jgi:hypothetical protein
VVVVVPAQAFNISHLMLKKSNTRVGSLRQQGRSQTCALHCLIIDAYTLQLLPKNRTTTGIGHTSLINQHSNAAAAAVCHCKAVELLIWTVPTAQSTSGTAQQQPAAAAAVAVSNC